jgi:general secretion pathway protein J
MISPAIRRRRTDQGGFTLLELLIASIVFAIMAMMAYGGLDNVIDISQSSKQSLERLRQVQQGVTIMSRDFSQLVQRPIRDEFGTVKPALIAGADIDRLVELTRGGRLNPAGLLRSSLQRVAYRLEDGILTRMHWSNLDRAQAEEPRETELLDEVDEFRIRFLDENAEWQEQWPPLNAASGDGQNILPPPLAIEIVLTLKDWGEIRRIYATAIGPLTTPSQRTNQNTSQTDTEASL